MATTPTPISDLPATTALADNDLVIVQKANGNTSKMTGANLKSIVTPAASTWGGTTGKPFDEVGSGLNISLSGSTKKLNANAPSWASVTGKPFSSVGNGLTVENDQLKAATTWGSVDGKPFSSVEQGGGLSVENGALKLSDDPSVFNATYGTTPYSDIVAAHNAARPVTATDENGRIAYLVALTSARATFQTSKQAGGNSIIFYSVDTSNQWTSSPVPINGGSGESGIFYATYGETTYEEIEDAYNSGYDVRLSPATSLGIVIDGVTIVPHITQLKTIGDGEARFACLGRGIKTIILPTPSTQKKVVLFAAICDEDGWQTSVITEFVTSVNGETGDVTVSGGGGSSSWSSISDKPFNLVDTANGLTINSSTQTLSLDSSVKSGAAAGATAVQKSAQATKTSEMTQPVGIDSNGKLWAVPGGGGGGGGTTDHSQLTNRDASNQHPISAINGLQSALDGKQSTISDLSTIRSGASSGAGSIQKSAQASKTSEMTQPVGIDSNGKLWTAPSGGGGGTTTYSITPTTISFVHNSYVTLGITIEADGTITAAKTSGGGTVSKPVITMYSETYNASNVITKIPIPQSEGVHTDTLTVWWGQNTSWTTPSDSTNSSSNAPLTINYTVVATGGGGGGVTPDLVLLADGSGHDGAEAESEDFTYTKESGSAAAVYDKIVAGEKPVIIVRVISHLQSGFNKSVVEASASVYTSTTVSWREISITWLRTMTFSDVQPKFFTKVLSYDY